MKKLVVRQKFLGLIPCSREVEMPHIRKVSWSAKAKIPNPFWRCEGGGYIGYGETPATAWNDWANWALV